MNKRLKSLRPRTDEGLSAGNGPPDRFQRTFLLRILIRWLVHTIGSKSARNTSVVTCRAVAATMTRRRVRRWKVSTSTHASNHYDACGGSLRTDGSGESVQTSGSIRWDGFQRIDLIACHQIFIRWKSIPGDKNPRKQIRWIVHTRGSIRWSRSADQFQRMDPLVCMGPRTAHSFSMGCKRTPA